MNNLWGTTLTLKNDHLPLSRLIFLLGVFLKQFYILPSGSFQIGDMCFMLSFALLVVWEKKYKIEIKQIDKALLVFLVMVFLVNALHTLFDAINYMKSFLYYLFNFLVAISFREYMEDERFLDRLRVILQVSILCQMVVFLVGIGRGGSRYLGTFNDPNQFGFYIFSAFLIIFLLSKALEKGHPWLWFCLAFFLMLQSASVGMALGYFVFLGACAFFGMFQKKRKWIWSFLLLILFCVGTFFLFISDKVILPDRIQENFLFQRIQEKLTKASSESGISNDRGWFLLKEHPWKMLYGAGEGNDGRFADWGGEIHSSILNVLFYYGFVPFSIWIVWCIRQLKKIRLDCYCVYIALLAESITLVNNRQPFFWILLVLASSPLLKKAEAGGAEDATVI